jgi:mannitol-1-/sugar-/sorbitol-6-phosphatase
MSARLTCAAILFDLDGVLVDSRSVVERTWQRWAELRGVSAPDLVRRAHGRRSIETVREVAPHLDPDIEVAWLAQTELSDFTGVTALPGSAAILRALRAPEWAVVTSGGGELACQRLHHTALPVPPVLVAAEDVVAGKPAPDGYLLAARRLGIDPSKCVVVEDTPPGVAAGRSARAQVLALATTFPKAALADARIVATDLSKVQIQRSAGELTLHVMQSVA